MGTGPSGRPEYFSTWTIRVVSHTTSGFKKLTFLAVVHRALVDSCPALAVALWWDEEREGERAGRVDSKGGGQSAGQSACLFESRDSFERASRRSVLSV